MSVMYVYIDNWDGCDIRGRLFGYNGKCRIDFAGYVGMMREASRMLSRISFPQETFSSRTFAALPTAGKSERTRYSEMDQPISTDEHRRNATFIIHVRFRQNSTWQGEIKWVSQDKTQYFRSSLEMLKLMEQAIASEFGDEVEVEWE